MGKSMLMLPNSIYPFKVILEGVATAIGAVTGTTLVSEILTAFPSLSGKLVQIMSGTAFGCERVATHVAGANTIAVIDPFTDNTGAVVQIPAGTYFCVKELAGDPGGHLLRIFNLVNAMLILEETGGVVTTTGPGTEDVVYINNNPAGVFKPKVVKINFTNQTAAETVVVRTHHRDEDGGGLIKDSEVAFAGVQDPLLKNITLQPNRFGVDVTIERTAGVAKAYRWEVFTES